MKERTSNSVNGNIESKTPKTCLDDEAPARALPERRPVVVRRELPPCLKGHRVTRILP